MRKLTWDEWHALVIGWSEGFCLFLCFTPFAKKGEFHYYRIGQAVGFGCFFVFIWSLVRSFF